MSNPWTRKCISRCLTYWLRRLLEQSNLWTSEKLRLIFIKGENQLSLRTSNADNHHFTKMSYTCEIQSMTRKCMYNKKELLLWMSKNLKLKSKRALVHAIVKRKIKLLFKGGQPTSKHPNKNNCSVAHPKTMDELNVLELHFFFKKESCKVQETSTLKFHL